MFHAFRARKAPLLRLADEFIQKAKTDLIKVEMLIGQLVRMADEELKYVMFWGGMDRELCLSVSVFYLHAFDRRYSSLRICEDLQNATTEVKSNIIKKERNDWLNNIRKAVVLQDKKRESRLFAKLLCTLLQLHIVLDTVLQKIEKTSDITGIVKFEVLNKTYHTILQEISPFKKMANCFDFYNEINTNLILFQSEYIALQAKASCCCIARTSIKAKLEIQSSNALASFENALNRAANCEQSLEAANEVSESFIQFEREIERSFSPRSKKS